MNTSGDGRAEEDSRRDSFGRVPRDLGQDLPEPGPEAPPRTKCDNPAVAITVVASEQKHRDAAFKSPNRQAARDARAATTTTFKGVDWSDYVRGGGKTLGIVDAPPTRKRPTAKTPPPTGPQDRDSGRRAARRPYGKSPPKVSED